MFLGREWYASYQFKPSTPHAKTRKRWSKAEWPATRCTCLCWIGEIVSLDHGPKTDGLNNQSEQEIIRRQRHLCRQRFCFYRKVSNPFQLLHLSCWRLSQRTPRKIDPTRRTKKLTQFSFSFLSFFFSFLRDSEDLLCEIKLISESIHLQSKAVKGGQSEQEKPDS